MTDLTQITASAGADVPINRNFQAVSPAAVFGRRYGDDTGGLDLGLYGGLFGGNDVADLVVTLDASEATLYVVAARADGAVTFDTATTDWNDTTEYFRIGVATTGASTITGWVDHREAYAAPAGGGGAGDVVGPASSVADRVVTFDGVTGKLIKDSGTLLTDLALKTYVDSAIQGLTWKQAVRAATTANGTLATAFANSQSIDGVTLATGDRILLKNQTTGSENGIYTVNASGAPTRSTDADTGAELVNASVYVSEGTTLADTQWTCTTNSPITVGSTSLAFAQLSGGGGGMTNPMTTTGDIIYSSSGSTPARLAIGSGTQVLGVVAGAPAWVAAGGFTGGALTSALDEAKGADIARATTTNIGAATGNFVHLTGTTTVTGLGTVQAGTRRLVRFAGAGTLTHNATSLILPGGASITTAANDCAIFVSEGSGNWRCIAYSRASGLPIVNPTVSVASLTNWTGAATTASPNGSNDAAVSLTAVSGGTNADAIVAPKAAGANLAQIPDGTTAGGDKRGARATDWQKSRSSSWMVASGADATISGGSNNAATVSNATVIGGNGNTSSGTNSISGGTLSAASGTNSLAIGSGAIADANAAHVRGTQASSRTIVGADVWASGQRSAVGDHQRLNLLLRCSTADATPTVMTSDGQGAFTFFPNELFLGSAGCLTVVGKVSAHKTTNDDCKGWTFSAVLKRTSGGTVSVVSAVTPAVVSADAGASGWSVAVTADNTNKCLQVQVTGQAASAINWTCDLSSCEVTN